MSKPFVSTSGERTFTIVFLYSIIMTVTVSLRKPLARSICSIFPLCMESDTLQKSTNNIVASRFFARTSRIGLIVKIRGSISPKAISSKVISQFSVLYGSVVEHWRSWPQWCKCYTSVVLGYSEVTLLRKKEDTSLVHLPIVFWLYTALQCRSSMPSNCRVFYISGGITSSHAAFLFSKFSLSIGKKPLLDFSSIEETIQLLLVSCKFYSIPYITDEPMKKLILPSTFLLQTNEKTRPVV